MLIHARLGSTGRFSGTEAPLERQAPPARWASWLGQALTSQGTFSLGTGKRVTGALGYKRCRECTWWGSPGSLAFCLLSSTGSCPSEAFWGAGDSHTESWAEQGLRHLAHRQGHPLRSFPTVGLPHQPKPKLTSALTPSLGPPHCSPGRTGRPQLAQASWQLLAELGH